MDSGILIGEISHTFAEMLTTEKTIVSTALSLIVATVAAQTNYYPGSAGTITKSGYTYKYRNLRLTAIKSDREIQLYNASVSYLDEEVANRDGTLIPLRSPHPLFSGRSMTKEQGIAFISGFFTAQQKAILKGDFLWVEAFVDTSTGKIADVVFTFSKDEAYMNIPVETYRAIELALKQKFTITVTAEGLKRNYIHFEWSPEF